MQQRLKQKNKYGFTKPVFLAILFLMWGFVNPTVVYAAGIDSAYKYAWSNIGGYVNFAPSQSPITVTDSALTGYAWSANDGWINLAPIGSGVTNDGNGTLGGFAWDSSQGWISFTGVSINTSTGKFTGQATGANGYVLNFDCSTCDVRTDWRPAIAPQVTSHSFSGSTVVVPTSAANSPSSSGPAISHPRQQDSSTTASIHTALPSGSSFHTSTSTHPVATSTKTKVSTGSSFSHFVHSVWQSIWGVVVGFFRLVFRF